MKKVLKVLFGIFIALYLVVASFLTVCLLSYNDYKISVIGNKSLIILDDSFVSLDPIKLEKAKDLIKDLSNDWQIIYFTCHENRNI